MTDCRKEVLQQTKIRLREKYDVAIIELVEKHFWNALRYYVTNPLVVKGSIMLNKFFKLTLRLRKLNWKVSHPDRIPESKINLYKQILKNNDYEQSQSVNEKS